MRGMGRIFKRGAFYWIAYCYRGKEHRESSRSDSESQARKLLKRRLGELGTGRLVGPSEERLTFDDLAKMLLTDYEINGKRSVESVRLSVRHLRDFFGLDRAVDITADKIAKYVSDRQQESAANGSINRELAALKRVSPLRPAPASSDLLHTFRCSKRTTRVAAFWITAGFLRCAMDSPITSKTP
jgi:hypothetical protein